MKKPDQKAGSRRRYRYDHKLVGKCRDCDQPVYRQGAARCMYHKLKMEEAVEKVQGKAAGGKGVSYGTYDPTSNTVDG